MNASFPDFSARLTAWQRQSGRQHLPWQHTRDPYRVWLSEIMLQQTQVSTVLSYYARFLERFPSVQHLAAATEAEVLSLWSGLGYYSRARNLHRCAQAVASSPEVTFPQTAAALTRLPGIGPSTAAAIAAFCFDERVSIFDGNVQRALARHTGERGDVSTAAVRRSLYQVAQTRLPGPAEAESMPAYTQGLMDLGATVCTPRRPRCLSCPVAEDCVALRHGWQAELPVKTRTLRRKTVVWWWLIRQAGDQCFWLVQRPPNGVWGALHSFPTFDSEAELQKALADVVSTGGTPLAPEALPPFTHVLTHLDVVIHPVRVVHPEPTPCPNTTGRWYRHPEETQTLGLPTPVQRWLDQSSR